MARVKPENALLPVYRKDLRKVLLVNLLWMRVMKKDLTFKKVMETQKELRDSERFDGWNRQNQRSINENSYSINCTGSSPFHKIKTSPTINVVEFFFLGPLYCSRFNKNCKQPNFIKACFIYDLTIFTAFCPSNRCVFDSICVKRCDVMTFPFPRDRLKETVL